MAHLIDGIVRRATMTKTEQRLLKRLAKYLRDQDSKKEICLGFGMQSYANLLELAEWLEGNCQGRFPMRERSNWG